MDETDILAFEIPAIPSFFPLYSAEENIPFRIFEKVENLDILCQPYRPSPKRQNAILTRICNGIFTIP
ncbi:hypothetical protein LEP1GSC058_1157 [Leptospira fainei serovar Hurstbridge str. BUT 6]|uniref:Uncharacterized protein n=1 Tax=Leptospira fainei serovar Hurstbridge str. BUT 6 TaxID=1193011 RepID=S3VXG5_9LEPT|nr:hypothetical protein LEP1GSC058_1157 [Leptospira fainei serovar Hurstbridge str. BUT 6]